MPHAAEKFETQTLKISSKRQITIPAQWYRDKGFKEYALCTLTSEGILIQPLDPHPDENVMVDILRSLIDSGYEGNELVEKYSKAIAKITSIRVKLDEAEESVKHGDVNSGQEFYANLREKYGL